MRQFLALAVAFTLGALCVEVKSQREINAKEYEIGRLKADVEGSYRDGIDAGMRAEREAMERYSVESVIYRADEIARRHAVK